MSGFLYLIGVVAMLGMLASSRKQPCAVDSECRLDECCALQLSNMTSWCRKKGNGEGKLCGGDFRCADCREGLQCTPFPDSLTVPLSNDTCVFPANGSCTYLVPKPTFKKPLTHAQMFKKLKSTKVQRPCVTDSDCSIKECCALRFDGEGKTCRNIGDEFGDSCGNYFCNSCRKGLVCVPTVAERLIPVDVTSHITDVAIPNLDNSAADSTVVHELLAFIFNSTEAEENSAGTLHPANGTCQYPVAQIDVVETAETTRFPLCHIGFKTPCLNDSHCRPKECCATHYNGIYKICKSKGGLGKPCGGDYFCPTCKPDFECMETPIPVVDVATRDLISTEYIRYPANGTCQIPEAIAALLFAAATGDIPIV